MRAKSSFFISVTLFTWFALLVSCSSGTKRESNSPEGRFQYAQSLEKEERYEEALSEYQEVKNKHPYSRFAVDSELAVADLHFKRESFVEAQSAYEIFKSLHPQHEKSDHVTFRLAMSFINQLPSTIDRDLTLAKRALLYLDEVLRKYPGTDLAKSAAEEKQKTLIKLAEKELYIAEYYFRKNNYKSSFGRFEEALIYLGLGFDERLLAGATRSAFRSGNLEKGELYAKKLLENFPETNYQKIIEEERSKNVQR